MIKFVINLAFDIWITSAVEGDSENIKQRLGGQRTVKKFMRGITCADPTRHQFLGRLPAGQKEMSHHLHKFSRQCKFSISTFLLAVMLVVPRLSHTGGRKPNLLFSNPPPIYFSSFIIYFLFHFFLGLNPHTLTVVFCSVYKSPPIFVVVQRISVPALPFNLH